MSKRILDVGQCGIDGPRMTRMLESKLGVDVVSADTLDDAVAQLDAGGFDLILVNREFAAEEATGLEFIRRIKGAGDKTPVMLVSDRPDAQQEAESAGAIHGFGKSAMNSPSTIKLIKDAVGNG